MTLCTHCSSSRAPARPPGNVATRRTLIFGGIVVPSLSGTQLAQLRQAIPPAHLKTSPPWDYAFLAKTSIDFYDLQSYEELTLLLRHKN